MSAKPRRPKGSIAHGPGTEPRAKRAPRGGLAVANARKSPPNELDYFPTPPWATRALCELVLPEFGLTLDDATVWEPACGEGDMALVLEEYAWRVVVSDVFDYGCATRAGKQHVGSFIGEGLDVMETPGKARGVSAAARTAAKQKSLDWIISNPPFSKAEEFVQRALNDARHCAMLLRSNWIEGQTRYEEIFRDHPPIVIAQFAERVPMHQGEWKPNGSTMTSYSWFVWRRGSRARTSMFWIPPGQKRALERASDRARFTKRTEAPLLARMSGGG